jgi:hypothetical protein
MKRLAITFATAIIVALALMATTVANASPPASMRCPAGFELEPLSFFVEEFGIDLAAVEAIDMNNNDHLCWNALPEHSPNSPIFLNAIDDVAFAKKP